MHARYALYYAPSPASELHRVGSRWLGRDSLSGETFGAVDVAGLPSDRIRAITAAPRVYGFHATLKPPFSLADNCSPEDLINAAVDFAKQRRRFEVPALHLRSIDGFLALVLAETSAEFDTLAADCVTEFDHFRAAPSAEELRRRRLAPLSPRQTELLEQWGYPYVLDEWRFHMTLTSRLEQAERNLVQSAIERLVCKSCESVLPVDAVAVFHQPGPGEPFIQVRRFPLA